MNTKESVRPFGLRDKIGYMFGDFGNDFTFIFASSFLMVFYTKVLGIHPMAVGTLFLVARCVDAFTDVTMGRIVDTLKPAKDGRFRPWIRRMCGPVAIAAFLMYQCGMASAPLALKIVYMYVTYLLWGSICYTAINIPYGSMASVISAEPADRAALSTFRSMGAGAASLIISVLAPLLVYVKDADGNQIVEGARFTVIAGVFSVCAVLCYLVCYKCTTERIQITPDPNAPKVNFGQTIATLFKNRALMAIVLASIVLLLSQLTVGTMNTYLFADYFRNVQVLSLMNFAGNIPIFIMAPVAVMLTIKFGKRESGAFAVFVAGAAYLTLFVLRVQNPFVYLAIAVIGFFGQCYFNMIIWANITDVIDYQEVVTGKRDDGTVYAVYSFARKIGQALAGGLGGYVLGAIGYDSAAKVQTEVVKHGIYTAATIVPAICFILVGVILVFLYPLTKKRVEENTAELKKRHAKQ